MGERVGAGDDELDRRRRPPLMPSTAQRLFSNLVVQAETLGRMVQVEKNDQARAALEHAMSLTSAAASALLLHGQVLGKPLHLPREPWTQGVHSHRGQMD